MAAARAAVHRVQPDPAACTPRAGGSGGLRFFAGDPLYSNILLVLDLASIYRNSQYEYRV